MFRNAGAGHMATVGPWAALPGALCIGAALGAAMHYPLAPMRTLLLLSTMVAWAMSRPADLWFVLPALLPVASFTPWSGWWLVDGSDLLILALMGGAYLRWGMDAWRSSAVPCARTPLSMRWVYLALPPLLLLGVWRGLDDARGGASWASLLAGLWSQGPYGDYDLPGNTLRVAKSLLWGLLLMPVLYRWPQGAPLRLARGMVIGLFLVCAGVVWERSLYVGLLDFSTNYRTTAWFWEMHVGGAAIDAYLAMALPFAWWSAWSAPRGWRWYAAAALVLLSTYAVLTTYSRGLYLAVVITGMAMGALAHRFHFDAPDGTLWHRRAMAWLLTALVVETMGVWLGGAFMSDRLVRSKVDLHQRMAHWKRGVGLLHTPGQWMLGLGVGRLPAHYSGQTAEGALPGHVRWQPKAGGGSETWLFGPARPDIRGGLALAQRVALVPGGGYKVRLRAHMGEPVWVKVQLCEQHLLYTLSCQLRTRDLSSASKTINGWMELPLLGPALASEGMGAGWREGVLSIRVLQAGALLRLEGVELIDAQGRQVLRNSFFTFGSRYWSSIAYDNFLPWHLDNLLLELLVERGLLGLLVLAALVLWALVLLWRGIARHKPLALTVAGSIAATLLVGCVVSFIEIPRVSIMLWLLLVVSVLAGEDQPLRQP